MQTTQDQPSLVRARIAVRGVVQGVGFRPFVFNLAERLRLHGWVLNNSGGVQIEIEGAPEAVHAFVLALRSEAPPLARIESIDVRQAPPFGYDRFEIRSSESQEGRYQLISPDIATCPECQRELFDVHNRRYRYPFTNCTNCGPRFTIISDIPYDRPNTTMRAFTMCPDCQREYDDPHNRRFHAQPNACPVCGPQLRLVGQGERQHALGDDWGDDQASAGSDVVAQAARLLASGAILALKGLGGFHLACDATDAAAVRTLRERKRRPHKPFAVMLATLEDVRQHCQVSSDEEELLLCPQCPIVLLPWKSESSIVSEVAPGYRYLGVMLPYTPMHHLLLRDVGRPLVMTSGNLSEEPIAADNDDALRRLGALADAFVLHNRDIYARYDDSVWFIPRIQSEPTEPTTALPPQPIRRARGYAPFPVRLPFRGPLEVLACGAELKNTFCLTRDEYAFVSPHIGDMENLETMEHFEQTIDLYKHLFRVRPQVIAYDLHPDYMASRFALKQVHIEALHPVPVQHHHAHLAACLADNGWPVADTCGAVIGLIWDGTGYGEDGHIWGGEWLLGDYRACRRVAHLEYLPLPGGDAATRNPWRIAFSYLLTLLGSATELPLPATVDAGQILLLQQQIERRVNCPLTSSMGRLFDAVSALLGVCSKTSYEAQAAVELEMLATGHIGDQASEASYPFQVRSAEGQRVIGLQPLLAAMLADVGSTTPVATIAMRFHQTLARMAVEVCEQIAVNAGTRVVALSGGCFQNRLLVALTASTLRTAGFRVLVHRQVPSNDGGLSLGQAAIACQANLN